MSPYAYPNETRIHANAFVVHNTIIREVLSCCPVIISKIKTKKINKKYARICKSLLSYAVNTINPMNYIEFMRFLYALRFSYEIRDVYIRFVFIYLFFFLFYFQTENTLILEFRTDYTKSRRVPISREHTRTV